MILRFKLYSIAAGALLSTPTSDAFTVPSTRTTRATTAHHFSLNPDWDNEDFLAGLGGGKEDLEAANEAYYKQAEARAALDDWRMKQVAAAQQQQPPQPRAVDPAPTPQQIQQQMQPPPQQQMQPPTPQQQQPQQPQQQQFYDANGNPVSMPMVYDANGNLVPFNPAAMQQQQPPPPQPTQPAFQNNNPMTTPPQVAVPGGAVIPGPDLNFVEPPLPPKTKGTDSPRPVGYNPDAWAVSNTADLYFAQLKQDSKVRKIARMRGDQETANNVFGDDTIKEIGDSWNVNPYTREKNLAEARLEVEGIGRMQMAAENDAPTPLGISYKDKLAQIKAKRGGGGGGVGQPAAAAPKAVQPPVVAASAPPPSKVEMPKVSMPPPPKMEQPKVGMPAPAAVVKTPPPPPPPVVAAAMPPPPAAATSSPATGTMGADDVRQKLRTLQGLLIKHRGGPGFGAGRLKAPEAQRLEDTLEEVKGILRSEVGGGGGSMPMAAAAAAAPQPIATMPPPSPRTIPATPPAAPVPAQAATTTQPPPMNNNPLAGSVACVEAALRMYKESSPEDREAMMLPLRDAMMAAAATSNKVIAETELSAHKAAMEAGPSAAVASMGGDVASMGNTAAAAPAQPMMGFPTTYAVTNTEEEESVAAPSISIDLKENEKKLEGAYQALIDAKGDAGKLGLKNLSGDEANALADQVKTVRKILLEELNIGS